MKIVVGCPVRKRNWILPIWKEHVDKSIPQDWEVEFCFVVGDDDVETQDLVLGWDAIVLAVEEPEINQDVRSWGDSTRYEHMAFLRNVLLGKVRQIQPDYYLSLDSDILLNSMAIIAMKQVIDDLEVDACGGLTYLDPVNSAVTNGAIWRHWKQYTSYKRVAPNVNTEVDVLMAIKLMTESAYNVDYSFHRYGEDFGWSVNMKEQNKRMGFMGSYPSKHVMSPKWLNREDKRVGY